MPSAKDRREMGPERDTHSASRPAPTGALLTADQLGAIYQVSGRTIREWFDQGIIPAEVAIGRVYRFCPAKVAEALRAAASRARTVRTPDRCVVI